MSSARCSPTPCMTRAGGLRCRADLGRQVEPDLPRRVATPARSSCAARRSGTSCRPRTTWSASTGSCPRSTAPPVPVPRTLHLGDADSPLGAPFYVMERVVGHICRNALPPGYADDAGRPARRSARRSSTCSPSLHTVDPAAVGLAEFGRPAGFMERQLRRWSKQWEASRVEDAAGARRAARRPRPDAAAEQRGTRSSTATTGSTTPSCTRRGPAASSPSSTGR